MLAQSGVIFSRVWHRVSYKIEPAVVMNETREHVCCVTRAAPWPPAGGADEFCHCNTLQLWDKQNLDLGLLFYFVGIDINMLQIYFRHLKY